MFEQESISKFKQEHPDLWNVFGNSINFARVIPFTIGQQDGVSFIEMHRLMMWQKVLHYQVQSLFLLLQYQLDAGFALLRLAAELSRDVARIADDENMLHIWLEREDKTQRKLYKDRFKFHIGSPDEDIVKNTYDFCSVFGIHGHMTDSMFSKIIGTIPSSSPMVHVGVSDYGVLDTVHMWLLSFLPMHHLCIKTFISRYISIIPDVFSTLAQLETEMNRILKALSDSLESQKKPQSYSS